MVKRMLFRRQKFLIFLDFPVFNRANPRPNDFCICDDVITPFAGKDICLMPLRLNFGPFFACRNIPNLGWNHMEILTNFLTPLIQLNLGGIGIKPHNNLPIRIGLCKQCQIPINPIHLLLILGLFRTDMGTDQNQVVDKHHHSIVIPIHSLFLTQRKPFQHFLGIFCFLADKCFSHDYCRFILWQIFYDKFPGFLEFHQSLYQRVIRFLQEDYIKVIPLDSSKGLFHFQLLVYEGFVEGVFCECQIGQWSIFRSFLVAGSMIDIHQKGFHAHQIENQSHSPLSLAESQILHRRGIFVELFLPFGNKLLPADDPPIDDTSPLPIDRRISFFLHLLINIPKLPFEVWPPRILVLCHQGFENLAQSNLLILAFDRVEFEGRFQDP